jgi:hypothetical protein
MLSLQAMQDIRSLFVQFPGTICVLYVKNDDTFYCVTSYEYLCYDEIKIIFVVILGKLSKEAIKKYLDNRFNLNLYENLCSIFEWLILHNPTSWKTNKYILEIAEFVYRLYYSELKEQIKNTEDYQERNDKRSYDYFGYYAYDEKQVITEIIESSFESKCHDYFDLFKDICIVIHLKLSEDLMYYIFERYGELTTRVISNNVTYINNIQINIYKLIKIVFYKVFDGKYISLMEIIAKKVKIINYVAETINQNNQEAIRNSIDYLSQERDFSEEETMIAMLYLLNVSDVDELIDVVKKIYILYGNCSYFAYLLSKIIHYIPFEIYKIGSNIHDIDYNYTDNGIILYQISIIIFQLKSKEYTNYHLSSANFDLNNAIDSKDIFTKLKEFNESLNSIHSQFCFPIYTKDNPKQNYTSYGFPLFRRGSSMSMAKININSFLNTWTFRKFYQVDTETTIKNIIQYIKTMDRKHAEKKHQFLTEIGGYMIWSSCYENVIQTNSAKKVVSQMDMYFDQLQSVIQLSERVSTPIDRISQCINNIASQTTITDEQKTIIEAEMRKLFKE